MIVNQGSDRTFTGVIARVSARRRDSAVEKQMAIGRKQERVSGCFRTEATRFHAIDVRQDRDSRKFFRTATQVALFPIAAAIFGRVKQNVNPRFVFNTSDNLRELVDARPRAWTSRMRNHHKGWPIIRAFDCRLVRPITGDRPDITWRVFVMEQNADA